MPPFPEYQIVRESVRNKHEEDAEIEAIINEMVANITYIPKER